MGEKARFRQGSGKVGEGVKGVAHDAPSLISTPSAL